MKEGSVVMSSERPFFSIPGNPRVPVIVRLWATVAVVGGVIGALLGLVSVLMGNPGGIISMVVGCVAFLVGKGLQSGKRAAVYAFACLGGLSVLASVFVAVLAATALLSGRSLHPEEDWPLVSVLALNVFIYCAVLVSALRRWDCFD
jgi:hypothetical protein